MKYKMMVCDFDGTLYRSDYTLAPETIDAVREYRAAGGKFFIATGRLYQAIKKYADVFELSEEIITYQGAGVYDLSTDKLVMADSVDWKIAESVYAYLYENYPEVTVPMMFYQDQCIVQEKNPYVDRFVSIVQIDYKTVGKRLDQYERECRYNPNKMLALVLPEYSERVTKDLAERFGDILNVNRSNKVLIEMVAKNASKGKAVKWLADKYGISRENIICMGDAENDISMIEYAGLGVAMGNAMEKTKAAADYVCDTNDNNGVAQVIRDIALKE